MPDPSVKEEVFPGDELQLLDIAKRAKKAHDAGTELLVTPHEFQLLKDYAAREGKGGMWEKSLAEAFKDALPHVSAPLPWAPPEAAAFGSLPVVVRS